MFLFFHRFQSDDLRELGMKCRLQQSKRAGSDDKKFQLVTASDSFYVSFRFLALSP